jgi:hypothetical protein
MYITNGMKGKAAAGFETRLDSRAFGLRMGRIVPLALGAALSWPGHAQVSEAPSGIRQNAFTIQGFGTLGAARSSNGDVHVLRSIRHPEGIGAHWSARQDSMAGLQAQYRFSERIGATLQAVSYYGDDGDFKPNITAAFLKFDPDPRFSIRVGRVLLDMLMLADTRMVGYSYIPIRPTSEAYNVPLNYVDGINLRWRVPLGDGVLSLDTTAGFARENLPGYKISGSKDIKGAIEYQTGDWQFKYFYNKAWLAHENDDLTLLRQGLAMTPAPSRVADKLIIKDSTGIYQSLGAGYDDGAWQAQLVFDSMRYENATLTNGRAFHAFLGRRMGDLTPYVSYSRTKLDPKSLTTGLPDTPWFQPINAALAYAMRAAGTHMDSKTYTVGTRWDFRPNMALKAQVDFVRGGKPYSALVVDTDPDWDGKTTIVSVSLDFVF